MYPKTEKSAGIKTKKTLNKNNNKYVVQTHNV